MQPNHLYGSGLPRSSFFTSSCFSLLYSCPQGLMPSLCCVFSCLLLPRFPSKHGWKLFLPLPLPSLHFFFIFFFFFPWVSLACCLSTGSSERDRAESAGSRGWGGSLNLPSCQISTGTVAAVPEQVGQAPWERVPWQATHSATSAAVAPTPHGTPAQVSSQLRLS